MMDGIRQGWLLAAAIVVGATASAWGRELAGVIYAETAGLRPVTAEVKGGAEAGTDPRSRAQLQMARRWIGEVALSRGFEGVAPPATLSRRDRENREAIATWRMCRDAALRASEPGGSRVDGKRVLHFLLRKGGTAEDGGTPRRPAWARAKSPVMSLGPFRCVGGGDVPAGNNVWIDFFVDIAR